MSLKAQISYPACFAGFAGSSHFFAKSVRSTLSTFASTALLREGKGRGRDTLEQPFGMWGSFLSAGGQPRDRPKLQTLNCSVLPWVKWGISFPSGHVVGGLEISKPLGSTFSPYVGEFAAPPSVSIKNIPQPLPHLSSPFPQLLSPAAECRCSRTPPPKVIHPSPLLTPRIIAVTPTLNSSSLTLGLPLETCSTPLPSPPYLAFSLSSLDPSHISPIP